MSPWLRYLVAFVVFCHGFIYVRIGGVLPGAIKQWNGRSWLLGSVITQGPLVGLSRALHVIAGLATLACAVAIAVADPSWRPLGIAGSALGLVAFAVFWDGQGQYLAEEGMIGAWVSLAVLVCALTL